VKFLADMGIASKTVSFLKKLGYNTIHLREENLQSISDDKIVEKANKEKRIILTCDLDFGAIMSSSKDTFPSVIIFRLSDFRPENINRHLEKILAESSEIIQKGAILSVSDDTYRIRVLPI